MGKYIYIGVICSPRDPRFTGSNPAEVDGFFQNIKILLLSENKLMIYTVSAFVCVCFVSFCKLYQYISSLLQLHFYFLSLKLQNNKISAISSINFHFISSFQITCHGFKLL